MAVREVFLDWLEQPQEVAQPDPESGAYELWLPHVSDRGLILGLASTTSPTATNVVTPGGIAPEITGDSRRYSSDILNNQPVVAWVAAMYRDSTPFSTGTYPDTLRHDGVLNLVQENGDGPVMRAAKWNGGSLALANYPGGVIADYYDKVSVFGGFISATTGALYLFRDGVLTMQAAPSFVGLSASSGNPFCFGGTEGGTTFPRWKNLGTALWRGEVPSQERFEQYVQNPWLLFSRPAFRSRTVAGGGGENVYNVDLTEAGTAADAWQSQAATLAAISESVAAADTPTRVLIAAVSLSEAGTASEAVAAGAQAYEVSLTEAASAADAVTNIAARVAALSESLAAADAITVSAVYGAVSAEAATAQDATNWGSAFYSVEMAEAATLADAVAAGLQALAAMAESASATDLPMVTLSAGASVTEVLSAVDSVSGLAPQFISAAMSESAAAVDVWVAVISGVVVIRSAPPIGNGPQPARRGAVLSLGQRGRNLSTRTR